MSKRFIIIALIALLIFASFVEGGKPRPKLRRPKGVSGRYVQNLFNRAHRASRFVWAANLRASRRAVSPRVVLRVRAPPRHPLKGVYRGPVGVTRFMRKFKARIYGKGKKKAEPRVTHVQIFPTKRRVDFHMRKKMLGPKGKVIKNFTWIARYTMGRSKGKNKNKIVRMRVWVKRGYKRMAGKKKGPKQILIARARRASGQIWKAKIPLARKVVHPRALLVVRGPKGHPLVGVYRGPVGLVRFTRKFKKMVYNPGKRKRQPKVIGRPVANKRRNAVLFRMRKPMLGPNGKRVIKRFRWNATYRMGRGRWKNHVVGMSVKVTRGFKQMSGKKP